MFIGAEGEYFRRETALLPNNLILNDHTIDGWIEFKLK
jgi:hypothetical protein